MSFHITIKHHKTTIQSMEDRKPKITKTHLSIENEDNFITLSSWTYECKSKVITTIQFISKPSSFQGIWQKAFRIKKFSITPVPLREKSLVIYPSKATTKSPKTRHSKASRPQRDNTFFKRHNCIFVRLSYHAANNPFRWVPQSFAWLTMELDEIEKPLAQWP